MLDGSLSNVSRAQSGLEAATLVEAVHSWIFSAALKQDMVAAGRPSRRKRRLNHGSTVALSLESGVSNDVLEKRVSPPAPQEIWCGDQHTCCYDPGLCL
jgi:hypothetical protein